MTALKIYLPQKEVEEIEIWQAATGDGYWEDKATKDIQRVYLLGQLRATESMHGSFGNNASRLRIKRLKSALEELEQS